MKTITLLLVTFVSLTTFAQYKDIDKMSDKRKEKVLIKIANDVINHVSEGYLRDGAKPIIKDLGLLTIEKNKIEYIDNAYCGRKVYTVEYGLTNAEKEYFSYLKIDYLIKVYIVADEGKSIKVMYADSEYWTGAEPYSSDIPKKKYLGVEGHKKRYPKLQIKTIVESKEVTARRSMKRLNVRDSLRRLRGLPESYIIERRIYDDSLEKRPLHLVKYTKEDLKKAKEIERNCRKNIFITY